MSTYGDPHWMDHPATRYSQALAVYRTESVRLYRMRGGLPSYMNRLEDQEVMVLRCLNELWHAQEALHQHVLDRTPTDVLVHEAIHRAHKPRAPWKAMVEADTL